MPSIKVWLVTGYFPAGPVDCRLLFIVVNKLPAQLDLHTDPRIYELNDIIPELISTVNMLPAVSVPAAFYIWTF